MAKSIKLTYFNVQGKGETIRLILVAAKANFEESRINFEEWGPMKENTTFGQLPLINVDGVELAQSCTIVRYLARMYGLAGDGEVGFAHADMILEHVNDYIKEIMKARWAKTSTEKQELAENFLKKFLPTWLSNAEKVLKLRGGKWFSSNKLSYGDLAMHHALFWLSWKDERGFEGVTGCDERYNILDKYPLLKANYDRVSNIPEIKAYIESRPSASQQANGWGL
eukprot:TRINITY_DN40766_c0_g2_i1.p1 TRINITY_DN40766_c0_g2~~TRINITY_DN40766_c0_g2_i1.p1  ORF type:complete len:245 (-),score=65.43 TRINITY_DN40766_c0_g2_i1:609-1283(-)